MNHSFEVLNAWATENNMITRSQNYVLVFLPMTQQYRFQYENY